MGILTRSNARYMVAVGSLILYALVFPVVYPYAGITAAALSAIPALCFGWLLGVRGGLIFGVLALPLNLLLFRLEGSPPGGGLLSNLVGTGTFTLASLAVGWFRNLSQRVKQQAEELRAERQRLQSEIEKRMRAEERLLHEALYDPLTNLPNRRLFLNRLEHAFEWCKRNPDDTCVVLYLDLDRFKTINDSLGHDAGDQLLIDVAGSLKSSVRAVDTAARMGGDEFAVLLEAVLPPQEENVKAIVERIQHNLAAPREGSGDSVAVQASIGAVLDLTKYSRIDDVLRDADAAMYEAKAGGGNCFRIFDAQMRERLEAPRSTRA